MKTNESTKGTLTEESNLKGSVNQTEMTAILMAVLILLAHPVGFISTGRTKSHRAAWCDTKGIQTDGTCNCYTGTLIQPDGSARNCFHKKPRYTRHGSSYSTRLKSCTKNCVGPHERSCADFARAQRFLT